jgi:ASCH domain
MKAISVCQPWAWAIVIGFKTVENRSRPTRHRGPLAIHASKSRRYLGDDYTELLPGLPPWDELDYGALVGVVEVVDCVPLAEVERDLFAVGPWCWLLARARRIRPVPYKGQVSLFDVPDDLLEPRERGGAALAHRNESNVNPGVPDSPGDGSCAERHVRPISRFPTSSIGSSCRWMRRSR